MMAYPVDRITAPEEVVPPVEAPEAMVREPLVPEKVAPAKQRPECSAHTHTQQHHATTKCQCMKNRQPATSRPPEPPRLLLPRTHLHRCTHNGMHSSIGACLSRRYSPKAREPHHIGSKVLSPVNADADPDGMDAVPTGAVAIVTVPLEDAPLAPEVTSTEPPVSPVAAAVLPADNVTPPPPPELVDPTRREMGPAAPPAATPVAKVKAPLPPPPAAPVLKKTAPVDPNVLVEPDVN